MNRSIQDKTPYFQAVAQTLQNGASRWSRRDFFSRVGDGLCGAALAYLLGRDLFSPDLAMAAANSATPDLKLRLPHFEAKAKAVIQLFMSGGPSQVDLFDSKPALEKHAGQLPRAFLDNVESVGSAAGLL